MEIIAVIALTLSGLTLGGVLLDKFIKQFKEKKPDGSFVIKSSCCNKNEQIDDHSKRKDRHDIIHQ